MFQLLTNQVKISIYLIKISEIEISEDYTELDKSIMKRFYKRKMKALTSKK